MRLRLTLLIRRPVLLFCLILGASFVHAQSYILQNGAIVPAEAVVIRDNFLVQVSAQGAGQVERRVPLSEIVQLDFPLPPEFADAEAEIVAGRPAEALAIIEPLYNRFRLFTSVPGSPFPAAAVLRLRALLAGPDVDAATAAAAELTRLNLSPESRGLGLLATAELETRAGRAEIARLMIEEAVKDAPPEVRARAWMLRGDLAARRADHEEAAESYLRVQAFYGTIESLQPDALLAAARSLRAYGDKAMSERIFGELMDGYPGTPQSAIARRELGF